MSMYYNIEPVSFLVSTWFFFFCDAMKKLKTKRWNDIPGTIAIRLETNRRIYQCTTTTFIPFKYIYIITYTEREQRKKRKNKETFINTFFIIILPITQEKRIKTAYILYILQFYSFDFFIFSSSFSLIEIYYIYTKNNIYTTHIIFILVLLCWT